MSSFNFCDFNFWPPPWFQKFVWHVFDRYVKLSFMGCPGGLLRDSNKSTRKPHTDILASWRVQSLVFCEDLFFLLFQNVVLDGSKPLS